MVTLWIYGDMKYSIVNLLFIVLGLPAWGAQAHPHARHVPHFPVAPQVFCEALRYLSPLYGTDMKLSLAIAFTESSFRNIKSESGEDLGFFQIHEDTADYYGIDKKRLLLDPWYATEAHLRILSAKTLECSKLGKHAYSCYHSKTPVYRIAYAARVDLYYQQLDTKEVCK